MDTRIDAQKAVDLARIYTKGALDLLGTISSQPEGNDINDLVSRSARWMAADGDHFRPYRPFADRIDRVAAALVEPLAAWAKEYVGRRALPEDYANRCSAIGDDLVSAVAGAGLLMADGTDHPMRSELVRLVALARGKTVLRDGAMGGGYYSAHVTDEEIVDTILASNLLD